jgi:N-terminal domain of anti-restriction factor ArdC
MKLEDIKNRTKEAADYLVQSLEAGHSEVLTQYLGAMAKFHTYSFGNIMLIARQKPSATKVAGVRTWNSLGRFVRRGEKGILILAPMVGRKRQPGEETTGENGDEKNPQAQLHGFRAVYVFDRLSRDLCPVRVRPRIRATQMYFSIADEIRRFLGRIDGRFPCE